MKDIKCPFCNASEETQFKIVAVADNPQAKPNPYCYTIYQCECDAILKRNIWKNPSDLWVSPGSRQVRLMEDGEL